MDRYTIMFIKSGLIYLFLGVTLGLGLTLKSFIWAPEWLEYFPLVHGHLVLFGCVMMLIFGVAYHILPRFSGKQLYSVRLVACHFWLSNIGLVGMLVFFPLLWKGGKEVFALGLFISGLVAVIGIYIFIYNIWKSMSTLKESVAPRR